MAEMLEASTASVVLFVPAVAPIDTFFDSGASPEAIEPSLPKMTPLVTPNQFLAAPLEHYLSKNVLFRDTSSTFETGAGALIAAESIGLLSGNPGVGFLSLTVSPERPGPGNSIPALQDAIAACAFHHDGPHQALLRNMHGTPWTAWLTKLFAGNGLRILEYPDSRCWVAAAYLLDRPASPEKIRSLVDIDPCRGFEASPEFVGPWLSLRTYQRWPNSLFGFTHHSLVSIQWGDPSTSLDLRQFLKVPDGPYFRLALAWFSQHRNRLVRFGALPGFAMLTLPNCNDWPSHSDQARAMWKTWNQAAKADGGSL